MTGFRVSDVRIDFARCWVPQTTSTWQARKRGTEPTGRDGVRGELGRDVVWMKGFALRVIGMRERLTIACYPRRLKRKWTGDEELELNALLQPRASDRLQVGVRRPVQRHSPVGTSPRPHF